jgi:hypothetical protein
MASSIFDQYSRITETIFSILLKMTINLSVKASVSRKLLGPYLDGGQNSQNLSVGPYIG